MERAVTADGEEAFEHEVTSRLTKDHVTAVQEREQHVYGASGDVRSQLPRLQLDVEQETYRKLLPGYVRRFVEKAAPFVSARLKVFWYNICPYPTLFRPSHLIGHPRMRFLS